MKIIARFACKSLELCVQLPTLLKPWVEVTAPSGCQSLEKGEDASLDKDVGNVLSDLDRVKCSCKDIRNGSNLHPRGQQHWWSFMVKLGGN